jgi:hypothetical protein
MDFKEVVGAYAGGQIEIQNTMEAYLYRGEIREIVVKDDELRVKLKWCAKGEGFPPLPNRWVKADVVDYNINLSLYGVSNISDGRICLSSPITNETAALFPKDGSKLDPSKVEGLDGVLD